MFGIDVREIALLIFPKFQDHIFFFIRFIIRMKVIFWLVRNQRNLKRNPKRDLQPSQSQSYKAEKRNGYSINCVLIFFLFFH
jgi:hypothetical protein